MVRSDVTLDATVEVSSHVAHRDVGGEVVLLNLESGQYYGLNEVGSRLWSLLTRGSNLSSIHRRLLGEYSVDAENLERDILDLVGDLANHGLLAIDAD